MSKRRRTRPRQNPTPAAPDPIALLAGFIAGCVASAQPAVPVDTSAVELSAELRLRLAAFIAATSSVAPKIAALNRAWPSVDRAWADLLAAVLAATPGEAAVVAQHVDGLMGDLNAKYAEPG